MKVDSNNPPGGKSPYQSQIYYFCATGCRIAFEKDPEKYLSKDWKGISMESKTKQPLLLRLFRKQN